MTKTNTKKKTMTTTNTFREHLQGAILGTCDLWDTWSEWWENMTWKTTRKTITWQIHLENTPKEVFLKTFREHPPMAILEIDKSKRRKNWFSPILDTDAFYAIWWIRRSNEIKWHIKKFDEDCKKGLRWQEKAASTLNLCLKMHFADNVSLVHSIRAASSQSHNIHKTHPVWTFCMELFFRWKAWHSVCA